MRTAVSRAVAWLRARTSTDGGFTLVEVVISVSLLGLITGAATASMITATAGAQVTAQRAHESTDAQLISAFLVRDAQAAGGTKPSTGQVDNSIGVTVAPPALAPCTPANTRVRFTWNDWVNSGSSHANVASYALDTATHQLTRRACRDGVSSGDMVVGTRVADFVAVCSPSVCPGLPDLVTVTVTELANPAYTQFSYDLIAQLRPEAQVAPNSFNSAPVPLMALGGATCPSSGAFIDLHGNPTLQVQLGGVVVNAAVAGCKALNIAGSGSYAADNTSVLSPSTCPVAVTGCTTYSQPLTDPLAGLPTPAGTCSGGGNPALVGGHYQPGVYNNGVTVSPSTTATFDPGNYIFCNGLDVKGTVVAPNVLFYFAGGSLVVNANGTITIGSQTSGPWSPVSIWQPHNLDVRINGGAGIDSYKGIVYAPLSVVYISGGTNLQIGSVIAYAIDLAGNGFAAFGPGVTIVTPVLPPGVIGAPYSIAMTAASGKTKTPPDPVNYPTGYQNWQLVSGLPAGWAINATTGVLTGTPTTVASYLNVIIGVTDFSIVPITTTRTYRLDIGAGSLAIVSTSPLAQATFNTNYSMTFVAGGGNLGLTGAYQWTNTTPLPAGLAWTGNGVISGTPTVLGLNSFGINVKDDAGGPGVTATFSLTVNPLPTITTGTALLSTVTATFSKSQTFTGGTTTFIGWGILAGDSLPGGLSINSSTGVISGTPTTAATTSFTVVLTDVNGAQATRLFTMTVYAKPVITTASLPAWDAGTPYPNPTQMTISGGSPPLNWSATGMPTGLSLTGSGAVLGTPTTAGTYSAIVVTATDQSGVSATANFSVVIAAALVITTPTLLPDGELPLAYGPITATTTGGTGTKTWTASGLPPGVSMSAGGVISGAPTSAGPYNITITVTDSIGVSVSKSYTVLTIFPALTASLPTTLPNWDVSIPYPQLSPSVSGGSGSYVWSAIGLPSGLAINASTGAITGTPLTAGVSNPVTIRVQDSVGVSRSATYSVTIYGPLVVTPALLPAWDVGVPYPTKTFAATGGNGPFIWSATGLPAGLALTFGGVLSGTPTAVGTSNPVITVTDTGVGVGGGASKAIGYTIVINTAPSIAAPAAGALPTWTAGKSYAAITVSATGGAAPLAWSASGLPPGLSINATTGVISGTPNALASTTTFNVTVSATDAVGIVATRAYTITINPAIVLTGTLPNGVRNVSYSAGLTLTPGTGTGPFTWSASGLPAGLVTNSSTGVISGTPTVTGTFSVTVTVTDAVGAATSLTTNLVIPPLPTAITIKDSNGNTNGKVEKGDKVVVTFSEALSVGSICSAWTGNAAAQTLGAPNGVLVTVLDGAPGVANDKLTITAAGCPTFNFGTIDLGSSAYVSGGNVTFGGNTNATTSTVSWDPVAKTLTVVLGTKGGAGSVPNGQGVASSTAIYSPSGMQSTATPTVPVTGTVSTGNIQIF